HSRRQIAAPDWRRSCEGLVAAQLRGAAVDNAAHTAVVDNAAHMAVVDNTVEPAAGITRRKFRNPVPMRFQRSTQGRSHTLISSALAPSTRLHTSSQVIMRGVTCWFHATGLSASYFWRLAGQTPFDCAW